MYCTTNNSTNALTCVFFTSTTYDFVFLFKFYRIHSRMLGLLFGKSCDIKTPKSMVFNILSLQRSTYSLRACQISYNKSISKFSSKLAYAFSLMTPASQPFACVSVIIYYKTQYHFVL